MAEALTRVTVDLGAQRLTLWRGEAALRQWPVSTGANGPGEIEGSGCTPRGRHRVRAGRLVRTRRRCFEVGTGREYRVHGLAFVEPLPMDPTLTVPRRRGRRT